MLIIALKGIVTKPSVCDISKPLPKTPTKLSDITLSKVFDTFHLGMDPSHLETFNHNKISFGIMGLGS